MDDYSSVVLYYKQHNTVQSLVFFADRQICVKTKPRINIIMISLLNQCSVLSKDQLIAPLCAGFVLKLTNGKAITTNAVIHTVASFLFLSSTKMFFEMKGDIGMG